MILQGSIVRVEPYHQEGFNRRLRIEDANLGEVAVLFLPRDKEQYIIGATYRIPVVELEDDSYLYDYTNRWNPEK